MTKEKLTVLILLLITCFTACDFTITNQKIIAPINLIKDSLPVKTESDSVRSYKSIQTPYAITLMEQRIIEAGLIDIKTIDTSIVVDLKYSTKNNFLGIDVYGDFNKCYLQPDVAEKLKTAQQLLKSKFPYYSLIVYDAVRPRSIQYKMWDTINVSYYDRPKYLSNPKYGSLHNYGAAVDVSIINENGYELDMGTAFDYFGELAYPEKENSMLAEGKLTRTQWLNRELLRDVMKQAGFFNIQTEWWHFNSCYRSQAIVKYKIVE
jgi:zinc D-Ala-D-Ala dipeptidase